MSRERGRGAWKTSEKHVCMDLFSEGVMHACFQCRHPTQPWQAREIVQRYEQHNKSLERAPAMLS